MHKEANLMVSVQHLTGLGKGYLKKIQGVGQFRTSCLMKTSKKKENPTQSKTTIKNIPNDRNTTLRSCGPKKKIKEWRSLLYHIAVFLRKNSFVPEKIISNET